MNILEWIFGVVLAIFVFMSGLLIYAIVTDQTPQARHYKQCLNDGQKEYVCWSMIYGGH